MEEIFNLSISTCVNYFAARASLNLYFVLYCIVCCVRD